MDKRERGILRLRYMEDETLEEIGAIYKISRERVRQIEARALRKVREEFEAIERRSAHKASQAAPAVKPKEVDISEPDSEPVSDIQAQIIQGLKTLPGGITSTSDIVEATGVYYPVLIAHNYKILIDLENERRYQENPQQPF